MKMAAPVGCFDTSDSKTNLIINYLPQGYTDEEFQALFQTVGPLKSCKICRNKATGYSYGFGFVEYYTPEHAQLAIDTLNGYQIHNKFLKVALSRKGGEKIKGANLYVRNFPKSWTSEDLKSLFVPYGNIINGKVLTDPVTGFSRGVGFILYNLKSEAEAAINALNNTMPLGTTEIMYVRFADDNTNKLRPPVQSTPQFQRPSFQITPSQRALGPMAQAVMNRRANRFNPLTTGVQIPPPNPVFNQAAATTEGCTLFVYNIGVAATEAEVFQLFAPYGEVKKVNIMWDWEKGQCKGFCFVTMATIQQAQAAIVALNGYQYATRPLQVKLKTVKV